MSIWVVRGGKFGEYENRFLQESKVYLTRDGFKTDLNKIAEQAALRISLEYRSCFGQLANAQMRGRRR